jgi:multidrug efflux pump subunit AcrA (membrane-fusion protein)
MKKAMFRLTGLAILAGLGWGGYRLYKSIPERMDTIPTAKVQKGDVVIRAFSRGELRAVRAQTLLAPNLNGTIQVTQLAPVGSLAKEKDLVVEYDDSERQAALEEQQLSVQSVDEQIKRARADIEIQDSQDKVQLLKARYDVRRAELEVKRETIINAIDARKNRLMLEQAKRALERLETDIAARKEQSDSQLAVLQQQRNRSLLEVQRELNRIALTRTLAPMTGLVSIRQNRGGFINFGQQVPEIREGDTLQPGMPVADVLDLSELEVWAKIGEMDRANLKEGQEAILQLDAIPDKQFRGTIKTMSGTATADVFSGDPSKKFDVIFAIDMRQLLTGLGMKEADINRIMATAEANSKKNFVNSATSFFASLRGDAQQGQAGQPGQPGQPGMQGGDQGQGGDDAMGGRRGRGQGDQAGGRGGREGREGGGRQGGDQAGGRGGREGGGDQAAGRGGQGGRGGFANLSEEDRQKFQALRTKLQNAPEGPEREKVMAEMNELRQKLGVGGGRGGDGQGRGGREGGGDQAGGRGGREGREGGGFGGPAGGRGGRGGGADVLSMFGGRGASPYSEEERKNARLPLPPEQDSQVQALLRPGLLADVEIIVEKIPNALHIPAQAVFDKGGKPTVFVQTRDGKFEPREIQLLKRSESTMVLSGGVQPGEIIAMQDLAPNKSDKKGKNEKKQGGGGAMSGMPATK